MNVEQQKNSTRHVPASQVARVLGYTPDYVSKLAREGKIEATQIGRRWYVNLDSARGAKELIDREKLVRSEKIRRERKQEQKIYEQQEERKNKPNLGSPVLAFLETAMILLLGLTLGSGGFFVFENTNYAQEAQVERDTFEKLAILVYNVFTPDERDVVSTRIKLVSTGVIEETVTTPNSSSATTTFTTLIVAPDELFTETQVAEVRESFSDEVEISVDPNNPDTGIITPVFRDRRGDDYRYLMMPVPKPNES